jgi:hypothetical protein
MKKPMFPEPERPYKSFFEEDLYKEEEAKLGRPKKERTEEYVEKEEEKPRRIQVERRTIHKMITEPGLEPLRRVSPKVIGNLFDRVEFLKQRMIETKNALEHRKTLHNELIREVDVDIEDKQKILAKLSDVDDIRDFKLDISTLRMEKRRENLQFWRDVLELTTELRELMEEYQMESKIASLFKDLKPGV